ncbi:phosphotransferase family protein [Streptomyces sp. MS19]|uniref:phosphotransferase family protein n=1 Tax=Streptomyces sp. MS19 TaxID=3385972 RepID=UPI0039A23D8F
MTAIDGQPPPGAREITTGQANRVWHTGGPAPYILKHYTDPGRAANEAAALTLLAHHQAPAPRLLAADPTTTPAWTAQQAIQAEPVPASELPRLLARPLAAIHRIPGPHAGRLAGARHHPTWPAYLHDRLGAYTAAAPRLAQAAARLHQAVDTALLETVEPRLLHHDLQPGHLIQQPDGTHLLLDWELAAYGDPLSDLARLAVRLHLPDPLLALAHQPSSPHTERRIKLYWHIHRLADTAYSTGPRQHA